MASSQPAVDDDTQLQMVVLKALTSLYQPQLTNLQEMQAADAFLRGFQLTPAAFDVCASLLDQLVLTCVTGTIAPDSVPVVFFSAQTLANKLRRQYSTSMLDCNSWTQRIVTWLSCRPKLPKIVVTQLVLALVAVLPRLQIQDLKAQTTSNTVVCSSQLVTVIQESCVQCNGHSVVGYALLHLVYSGVTTTVLAELLLLIVEEIDTLTGRNARQRMQDEVDAWAPLMLDRLLPQLMHEASNQEKDSFLDTVETQETVLRTLTSWLRCVQVTSAVVVRNPLLHSLLSFLARDELFDAAVDLAVELVRSYSHDKVVVQWVAPRLLSLRGAFQSAAEREDVDSCLGLCRIFTEMGESYLELLLQENGDGNDTVTLVDLLLDCMSYPDAEVADVTIPFWFRLLAELQRHVASALLTQYNLRLERLAGLCMKKLQFRDEFLNLPADTQQDFKAFRLELSDILRDCCQLLGVETILQHCVNGLNQIFQTGAESKRWEAVEAHLYCFRSIAREVEKSKSNAESLDAPITLIFQHLRQFADHPAICYTSCLIVSRYAVWLRMHPTLLSTQVEFLNVCVTMSAEDPRYAEWEVARAAATAVRALAIDCWAMLGENIVAFYLHIEQHEVMVVDDQVLILEGVCAGVAGSGDMQRIVFVLDQVMKGVGQRLTTLFASTSAKEHVQVALNELLRLMCIYEYLDIPATTLQREKHPLVMLTEQLWPLINKMLALYRGHDELVERVCRCYKRILRTCGEHIVPLLPQLVDNLLAFYQAEPKSSYLYTASMVLKFFSSGNSSIMRMDALFERMLFTLIEVTTPIFASVKDMEARPDVVEEFFFLMERAVRLVPQVLAAPVSTSSQTRPLIANVFSCAVSALNISHNDANKAVLCFLEHVFKQSQANNSLVKLTLFCASDSGEHETSNKMLINYLMRGVVLGTMSPSRVDADYGSVAGVMVQLAKVNGPQLLHWITEWFEQATVGTFATAAVNFLTPDETQEFQSELSSAASERAFRRTVRHFGKLCASRNTSLKNCDQ
ncbi:unnamed protein product [Peronospora belbahrii]|uniref:Exportin-1/Importin-beta-like domain-containing protein n=1 Tax=Peronospora belbahrii TaxID=622444 RepID=A0AAU9L5C5_9STRA|nr:unnamed protein product [Peronospora belbahrii]